MCVKSSFLLSASLSVFLFTAPAYAVVAVNNGGGGPGGTSPAGEGDGKDGGIDPVSVRDTPERAAAARGMVLSDDICTGGKYLSCDDNRTGQPTN